MRFLIIFYSFVLLSGTQCLNVLEHFEMFEHIQTFEYSAHTAHSLSSLPLQCILESKIYTFTTL